MAVKVRNTVVNGGMSGRDASIGKVFSFREGATSSTMKRYTAPSQPNTPKQIAIRNQFTESSSKWSLLTDAQRDSWKTEQGTGGKENFVATNIILKKAGIPLLDTARNKDKVSILTGIEVSLTSTAAELEFNADSVLLGEKIQIEVSKEQSYGTSAFKEGVIVGSFPFVAGGNVVDIRAAITAANGSLSIGTKVFFKVYQVSLGGARYVLFQGEQKITT